MPKYVDFQIEERHNVGVIMYPIKKQSNLVCSVFSFVCMGLKLNLTVIHTNKNPEQTRFDCFLIGYIIIPTI